MNSDRTNNATILAVDTTQPVLALALKQGTDDPIVDIDPAASPHSSFILVKIEALLAREGLSLADVSGFAVNIGPGSFTGIRVGLASLLGLASTLNKPLFGVSALDAIAMSLNAGKLDYPLTGIVLSPAFKGEWYFGGRRLLKDADDSIEVDSGNGSLPVDQAGTTQQLIYEIHRRQVFNAQAFFIQHQIPEMDAIWQAFPSAKVIESERPLVASIASAAARQMGLGIKPKAVRPYYVRMSEAELKINAGK